MPVNLLDESDNVGKFAICSSALLDYLHTVFCPVQENDSPDLFPPESAPEILQ